MKKEIIEGFVGFVFIIFGIFWSLFAKFSCKRMCYICLIKQDYPCIFLFLFVGIIFVVSGASLINNYLINLVRDFSVQELKDKDLVENVLKKRKKSFTTQKLLFFFV